MAHFYGTMKGNKGATSRLGSKKSGIVARVASWQGAVEVELFEFNGEDWALVRLTPHMGAGVERVLYRGPVNGLAEEVAPKAEPFLVG